MLAFLSVTSAWGGSILVVGDSSTTCSVTTLQTDTVVGDCNSVPGIGEYTQLHSQVQVTWGNGLLLSVSGEAGMHLGTPVLDPNYIATLTLTSELLFQQNFIITGDVGSGQIVGIWSPFNRANPAGGMDCYGTLDTGPAGALAVGVPFSLSASVIMNRQISLPGLYNVEVGAGCDGHFDLYWTNAQGQIDFDFDGIQIQTTDLAVSQTIPEPRTLLLTSFGLLVLAWRKTRKLQRSLAAGFMTVCTFRLR
ncbi:MAG: hypothetical protein ABI833_08105 [Acidobacteriota bacterium]